MSPSQATDYVIPFLRETEGARGRIVRLGPVANTILSRYEYPTPVANLLGELLLVAAMLGNNLKQEGIFTIQLRGSGPVSLIVVDAAYGGQLRGFADVKPEAVFDKETYRPAELVGKDAYLAITLDPGEGMQRYQGVVALEGETITEALVNYFTYSQQLDVLFNLTVEKQAAEWVAGGFMLERMPDPLHLPTASDHPPLAGGRASKAGDRGVVGLTTTPSASPQPPLPIREERIGFPASGEWKEMDANEAWRTTVALASTIKPAELIDPLLEGETLLYQLFHEEGVRVYPPQPIRTGCRCSRERILNLLLSMPLEDRADMVEGGEISVHCQFCNSTEKFSPQDVGLPATQ